MVRGAAASIASVGTAGRGGEARRAEWLPIAGVAAAVFAALVATSARYGYHRDELYFLAAGRHPAWGYVDQPPLTPMLARLLDGLAPDSLIVLRLPSAAMAAAVVLCTAALAGRLGASRTGRVLGAAAMGVSAILLAVTHLLSTSTLDVLAWTVFSLLVVTVLQGGDERWWLAAGAVAGVALLNKTLFVFLPAVLVVALLIGGPRDVFRSRWLWMGAAIAGVLWAPNLLWQAANGWPQLELSRAIASGSSGTSEPVALFVPFQLVLISPVLVPLWVAGLVRLLRGGDVQRCRAFGWTYLALAVLFMATGGKPYYLAGMYPVLLAAGAKPAEAWLTGGRAGLRRGLTVAAVGLSAMVSAVLFLPLVPVTALGDTPIVDINYDAGETVGWPQFAEQVADVVRDLPAQERAAAVVVTRNYGQAGALERYGETLDVPSVYSGHDSYAEWGPPPAGTSTAVIVGYDEALLRTMFQDVQRAATIDNGADLDNDEQGTAVWVCRETLRPWDELWPNFVHLG